MHIRVWQSIPRGLAALPLIFVPAVLAAQVVPSALGGPEITRWSFFVGYSDLTPNTIVVGQVQTKADCTGSRRSSATQASNGLWNCPLGMEAEWHGMVESVTRRFSSRWGVQIDAAQHDIFYYDPKSLTSNSGIMTVQAGPVYRVHGDKWVTWVHGLAGGGVMQGPDHQNYTPGLTFTGGGGLDVKTHWMGGRIAVRLADADYEYMRVNYGAAHSSHIGWQPGGIADMSKGVRLSAGLVYHPR